MKKKNQNTIIGIVLLLLFFLKKKKPVGTVEVGEGQFGKFGTDNEFEDESLNEGEWTDYPLDNKVAIALKG